MHWVVEGPAHRELHGQVVGSLSRPARVLHLSFIPVDLWDDGLRTVMNEGKFLLTKRLSLTDKAAA